MTEKKQRPWVTVALALIGAAGAAVPGVLGYLEARDANASNQATEDGAKAGVAACEILVEELSDEWAGRYEELWRKGIEAEARSVYLERRVEDLEARHRIRSEEFEPAAADRAMPDFSPLPKPKKPKANDPRLQRKIQGYDWEQRTQ